MNVLVLSDGFQIGCAYAEDDMPKGDCAKREERRP
jgi:hypothetical protein